MNIRDLIYAPRGGTRCKICGAPIIVKADRSKPSEQVEWDGVLSKKMYMYPSLPPEDLCYYHKGELNPQLPGRES